MKSSSDNTVIYIWMGRSRVPLIMIWMDGQVKRLFVYCSNSLTMLVRVSQHVLVVETETADQGSASYFHLCLGKMLIFVKRLFDKFIVRGWNQSVFSLLYIFHDRKDKSFLSMR